MTETTRTVLNGTFLMDTDAGPLAIMNTNFVEQKLLTVYKYILDEFADTGHGLTSIIFRADGYPSICGEDRTIWVYQPDSMSAVANLQHIVKAAIDITMDIDITDAAKIGIKTLVWMNLVKGLLHELYHAQSYMTDRELLDSSKDERMKDEEDADTYSNEKIISLAKEINIEPVFGEFLENLIHQEYQLRKSEVVDLIESIRKGATNEDGAMTITEDDEITIECYEKWITLQEHMFGSGQSWYTDGLDADEDGKPIGLASFKEYMCWMDESDMADKEWARDTLGVKQFSTATPPPTADGNYYEQLTAQPPQHPVAQPDVVTGAGGWVSNDPNEVVYEEEGWYENQDVDSFGYQPPAQQYTPTTQQPPVQQPYAPPVQPQGQFTNPHAQEAAQNYQAANPVMAPAPQPYAPPVAPPTQPAEPQYTPNVLKSGMSPAEMGLLMHGLYRKLFDHMFGACQWDKSEFLNKQAIQAQVPLTPEENAIVTSMVTQNETGSYMEMPAEGYITGKIMDRQKELPGYEFKFVDHLGNVGTRKLIPQNPKKTRADGALSYTAEMAQHGWQIVWIINPDESDKQFSNRMMREPGAATIKMEHNRNGKWE